MKIHGLLLLAGSLLIGACSSTISMQSTSKNPPGNETIADKNAKVLLSVANDGDGILINIKIPSAYDQYKVLKYGASLYVNMHNEKKPQYQIAYPLTNNDKGLRLPIVGRNDTSFHMNKLIASLSEEATQMDLVSFYGKDQRDVASNRRDSVAVQVFNERNGGPLTYSAFIPYKSIPEFARYRPTRILIGFESGNLEVPREYTDYAAYDDNYDAPRNRRSKRYKGGQRKPAPDLNVVKNLSRPIQFWAKIDLAHR